jgi:hypothetical protein
VWTVSDENRWSRAQREYEEQLEAERRSMPREARVAEGASWFQELGLPVAIVAGLVWLVRRVLRRGKH